MSEQRKDEPERIDINQPGEVRRWAERFGVTEEEIRQAVKAAGPQIAAVRARLAAKLPGDVPDLGEARWPARVATADEPTVRREWDASSDGRRAFGDKPVAFAIGADTQELVVHQLLDRKGVVRMYHPGAMPYGELAAHVQSVLKRP